jgi:hypothetical protein
MYAKGKSLVSKSNVTIANIHYDYCPIPTNSVGYGHKGVRRPDFQPGVMIFWVSAAKLDMVLIFPRLFRE